MKSKIRHLLKTTLGYTPICINVDGEEVMFRKRYKNVIITIDIEHEKNDGYVTPLCSDISTKSEVQVLHDAMEMLEHDLEELNNVEP